MRGFIRRGSLVRLADMCCASKSDGLLKTQIVQPRAGTLRVMRYEC